MIYSLTASHYDSEGKYILLKHMIESLLLNGIDYCYISISFNDYEHYNKNKIKTYIHFVKLYQFEHIEYIQKKIISSTKDNDIIVFCDDDDLLLSLPKLNTYDAIIGYQYYPNTYENIENKYDKFYNYSQIQTLIDSNKISEWKKFYDFSGTMCVYEILKNFFVNNKFNYKCNTISEIFKIQLIDCKFIDYLQKYNIKPNTDVYIFHRRWTTNDRKIQQWKLNFNNYQSIDEILDKVKTIRKMYEINYDNDLKKNNNKLIIFSTISLLFIGFIVKNKYF